MRGMKLVNSLTDVMLVMVNRLTEVMLVMSNRMAEDMKFFSTWQKIFYIQMLLVSLMIIWKSDVLSEDHSQPVTSYMEITKIEYH